MSKVDSERIIQYLQEKWKSAPCPMCGKNHWSVQENAFELREYRDGNMVIGGVPIIPVIPIICSNCGNTILINAILAGLVKRS